MFSPFLNQQFDSFSVVFEQQAHVFVDKQRMQIPAAVALWESIEYSLFSGGKRFRPFISYLATESLHQKFDKTVAFALAVEMIHTYSLIHDDLPCMDNDDYRRGRPTNHKVYGEDIALLAGDTLLTEAFALIAKAYGDSPKTALKLIQLLATKAGASGMISGQVIDMKASAQTTFNEVIQMHQLKTAALIEASVLGAVITCDVSEELYKAFEDYASVIGLAFQVKDDLLDIKDKNQDYKSYIHHIGFDQTVSELQKLTIKAQTALENLNKRDVQIQGLHDLLIYNETRTK